MGKKKLKKFDIAGKDVVRFIACFFKSPLFFLEGFQTFPELIERARDVPVLRVSPEIECLCPFLFEERQLNVVGEQEERVGVRHGVGLSRAEPVS